MAYAVLRECDHCGASYVAKHWNSLYCSDPCKKRAYYLRTRVVLLVKQKNCRYCGTPFDPKGTRKRYCGDTCRKAAEKEGVSGPRSDWSPGEFEEYRKRKMRERRLNNLKRCSLCLRSFQARKRGGSSKYCSIECASLAKRNFEAYSTHRTTTYQCENCLALFNADMFRKFCSDECEETHSYGVTECVRCFATFERTYADQKVCGDACLRGYDSESIVEKETLRQTLALRGKKFCNSCGGVFSPTRTRTILCKHCYETP